MRTWLAGMTISTVFCWGAWLATLFGVNPYKADKFTFALFFVTLFFALVGTFTLIGFLIRIRVSEGQMVFSNVASSFRQAFFISLAAIGLLLLQTARVLTWWDGILLVAAILLLELYLRAK